MSYPDAWGLSYQEVMGLAWLAYRGNGGVGAWNIGGNTWSVRNVHEHGSFRAVVIQGRRTVLSLAGTDDAGDWVDNIGQGITGVSGQYLRALKLARSSNADIVVGHSLGGGMASYCAIYGRRRAATINPAPLNINPASLVQMIRRWNLVINYVAPGEILALFDAVAITMRKVGRTHRVHSNGGFNPVARHGIANLDGFTAPTRVNMGDFSTA